MPVRFGLSYVGADNAEHTPVVIHRALLGSLERFVGILIEHTGGDLPFFMAPVQVRVVPVSDAHRGGAEALAERLREEGFRVELDDRDETVNKRIREAEVDKVPYVVVWGERESLDAIAVRRHGGEQSTRDLAGLVDELRALATI
jgi:threonyl-tRNA synthetase